MVDSVNLTELYNKNSQVIEHIFTFLYRDDKRSLAQSSKAFNARFNVSILNELTSTLLVYLDRLNLPRFSDDALGGIGVENLEMLVYSFKYPYWSRSSKRKFLAWASSDEILDMANPALMGLIMTRVMLDLGNDFQKDNHTITVTTANVTQILKTIGGLNVIVDKLNAYGQNNLLQQLNATLPQEEINLQLKEYNAIIHFFMSQLADDCEVSNKWIYQFILKFLPRQNFYGYILGDYVVAKTEEMTDIILREYESDISDLVKQDVEYNYFRDNLRKYINIDRRATNPIARVFSEGDRDLINVVDVINRFYYTEDPYHTISGILSAKFVSDFVDANPIKKVSPDRLKSSIILGLISTWNAGQAVGTARLDRYPYILSEQMSQIDSLIKNYPALHPVHRYILLFHHLNTYQRIDKLEEIFTNYLNSVSNLLKRNRALALNVHDELVILLNNKSIFSKFKNINTLISNAWLFDSDIFLTSASRFIGSASSSLNNIAILLSGWDKNDLFDLTAQQADLLTRLANAPRFDHIDADPYQVLFSPNSAMWEITLDFNHEAILFIMHTHRNEMAINTDMIKLLYDNPQYFQRIKQLSYVVNKLMVMKVGHLNISWLYIILQLPTQIYNDVYWAICNLMQIEDADLEAFRDLFNTHHILRCFLAGLVNGPKGIYAVPKDSRLKMYGILNNYNCYLLANIQVAGEEYSNLLEFIFALLQSTTERANKYPYIHIDNALKCIKYILNNSNNKAMIDKLNTFVSLKAFINNADNFLTEFELTLFIPRSLAFFQLNSPNKRKQESEDESERSEKRPRRESASPTMWYQPTLDAMDMDAPSLECSPDYYKLDDSFKEAMDEWIANMK